MHDNLTRERRRSYETDNDRLRRTEGLPVFENLAASCARTGTYTREFGGLGDFGNGVLRSRAGTSEEANVRR